MLGKFYAWMSMDYILDQMTVPQFVIYLDYMVEHYGGKKMELDPDEVDRDGFRQLYGDGQRITR